MSCRDSKSLDDTLPLEKDASVSSSSECNKSNYSSDLSASTRNTSSDSSVKIVYEIINLTDSESDDGKNKE